MRALPFLSLATLSACSTTSPRGSEQGLCPPLSPAKLSAVTAPTQSDGVNSIVFFASWCSSCKSHILEERNNPQSIFVGVFDLPEKIASTAQKMGIDNRCFTDNGLAETWGLMRLPAQAHLTTSGKWKVIEL